MTATIANGKLTVVIDLCKPPRISASGKSKLVASGTEVTSAQVDGKQVKVAINAYIPAE